MGGEIFMRKQEDESSGNDLALVLLMFTVVWLWIYFR